MAEQECVGFVDMDCFYVAVERTLDRTLVGVPCAVCQYESQQKDTKTVDRTENRKVSVGGASLIAVSCVTSANEAPPVSPIMNAHVAIEPRILPAQGFVQYRKRQEKGGFCAPAMTSRVTQLSPGMH